MASFSVEGLFTEEEKKSELYNWTVGTHYGTTVEEAKGINNRVADMYDSLYRKTGWISPINGSELLIEILSMLDIGKNCKIIDVGAGSGLVGECMNKAGYLAITGIDFAEKMLIEAEKKGVYEDLIQVDMYSDDLSPFVNKFDAAITTGTFTAGQLSPEIMQRVASFVRPGGVVCISIRDVTWENLDSGFANKVEELEKKGVWTLIEKRLLGYHTQLGENAYYLALSVN